MSSFIPRTDLLPENQQQLWPALGALSGLGFVLYGETALALQLGHRPVRDFEFFNDRVLVSADVLALPVLANCTVEERGPNWLRVRTADGTQLSFTGGISFGRVGNPVVCDNGVLLASTEDLMALRLWDLLYDRSDAAYRDLVALIRQGLSVGAGLAAGIAMFGIEFRPMAALRTLTSLEESAPDSSLTSQERRVLETAANSVGLIPDGAVLSHSLQPAA
ncbi:MAG: hypothetical protein Q4F72_09315 [Desulfovibrionaceae bacterium]|nr:hypothetical protein [Desulfovibrionaceae bacterium]